MSVKQNLEVHRGEDKTIQVVMSPVIDITGWTIVFTVKAGYSDTVALVTKSTTAGTIVLIDETNGVFNIDLDRADTSALAIRTYQFDIQRTDAENRTVLTFGTLTVLPAIGG